MSRRSLLSVPVAALVMTLALALLPVTGSHGGSGGAFFGLQGADTAHARRAISIPFGFADSLVLHDNGRLVQAVGPFGCETEDSPRWRVDVVIQQGETRAEGHTQGHCSGEVGTWRVLAVARGPQALDEGSASGCGVLQVIVGGTVTDSVSWCDDFRLVTGG